VGAELGWVRTPRRDYWPPAARAARSPSVQQPTLRVRVQHASDIVKDLFADDLPVLLALRLSGLREEAVTIRPEPSAPAPRACTAPWDRGERRLASLNLRSISLDSRSSAVCCSSIGQLGGSYIAGAECAEL
jgi:hypothetical protein